MHLVPQKKCKETSVFSACEDSQSFWSCVNEWGGGGGGGWVQCLRRHQETTRCILICCFSKLLKQKVPLWEIKRRGEGDDLCISRSQGKGVLAVSHLVEKTTLRSHLLGWLHFYLVSMGGSVCVCVFSNLRTYSVRPDVYLNTETTITVDIVLIPTSFRGCLKEMHEFMLNIRTLKALKVPKSIVIQCLCVMQSSACVCARMKLWTRHRQVKKWHDRGRQKERVCAMCLYACVLWGGFGAGRTGIMSDSRHPATSDFD